MFWNYILAMKNFETIVRFHVYPHLDQINIKSQNANLLPTKLSVLISSSQLF